jgi:hypothetical protein
MHKSFIRFITLLLVPCLTVNGWGSDLAFMHPSLAAAATCVNARSDPMQLPTAVFGTEALSLCARYYLQPPLRKLQRLWKGTQPPRLTVENAGKTVEVWLPAEVDEDIAAAKAAGGKTRHTPSEARQMELRDAAEESLREARADPKIDKATLAKLTELFHQALAIIKEQPAMGELTKDGQPVLEKGSLFAYAALIWLAQRRHLEARESWLDNFDVILSHLILKFMRHEYVEYVLRPLVTDYNILSPQEAHWIAQWVDDDPYWKVEGDAWLRDATPIEREYGRASYEKLQRYSVETRKAVKAIQKLLRDPPDNTFPFPEPPMHTAPTELEKDFKITLGSIMDPKSRKEKDFPIPSAAVASLRRRYEPKMDEMLRSIVTPHDITPSDEKQFLKMWVSLLERLSDTRQTGSSIVYKKLDDGASIELAGPVNGSMDDELERAMIIASDLAIPSTDLSLEGQPRKFIFFPGNRSLGRQIQEAAQVFAAMPGRHSREQGFNLVEGMSVLVSLLGLSAMGFPYLAHHLSGQSYAIALALAHAASFLPHGWASFALARTAAGLFLMSWAARDGEPDEERAAPQEFERNGFDWNGLALKPEAGNIALQHYQAALNEAIGRIQALWWSGLQITHVYGGFSWLHPSPLRLGLFPDHVPFATIEALEREWKIPEVPKEPSHLELVVSYPKVYTDEQEREIKRRAKEIQMEIYQERRVMIDWWSYENPSLDKSKIQPIEDLAGDGLIKAFAGLTAGPPSTERGLEGSS